jgi:RHS repeat-associated protein
MSTDSNGAFKGTQDHLPFGDDGGTSGTSEKHRFTNYERDAESGSDYAMNRQHQNANGRFMQPDPVAGTLVNPQSMNRYTYVLNDPINLNDPLGLYEGCVHQAMTEYLAKLSGRLSDSVAAQLGHFAGDEEGGADSSRYAATNPWNVFLGYAFHTGPMRNVHFASASKLAKEQGKFEGYIANRDFKNAGFVLHSIEDVHGAHLGLSAFDHFKAGHDPDRLIGDVNFINVANEVSQFLTENPAAKLTPEQYTGLLNAIWATCDKQDDLNKLTRPRTVRGGGGGGIGFGGGGYGGWWWGALRNFLNWLHFIPVGGGDGGEHLA